MADKQYDDLLITELEFNRFIAKIEFAEDGCWLWKGAQTVGGYSCVNLRQNVRLGHRVAFTTFIGPIPNEHEIDHTCLNADPSCTEGDRCRHRRCQNPDHLRAVSHSVNMMSGKTFAARNASRTHCPQGHPYDELNTYHNPRNPTSRQCLICRRRRSNAKSNVG